MLISPDSPFYPIEESRVITTSPNCIGFFDRYPVSRGHALVIPRCPVESLYELDDDLQTEMWQTATEVREILAEQFTPDGFNIGINDGHAAGQTIPHAHIHIIPRYAGDVPDPRGGIRHVIPQKAKYW